MEYLRVKNWDRFQHYKQRCPPWIKLHTKVLNDRSFTSLSCACRGLLMQLWVLASEDDGKVLYDLSEIRFRLRDNTIKDKNIKLLITKGFLAVCKQVLASACLETETETETETEEIVDPSGSTCPHTEIIEIYHLKCPSLPIVQNHSEYLQKRLRARWREDIKRQSLEWWEWYFENVSVSDFLTGKVKDWAADFGWLIGPKNMTKVLNGRYVNRNKATKTDQVLEDFINEHTK